MSAAAAVLPMVWAYAEPVRVTERKGPQRVGEATTLAVAAAGLRSLAVVGGGATRQEVSSGGLRANNGGLRAPAVTAGHGAFYRKYTEGLLRRYVKMAMESGKTPSLLGKEMFRGKVTNYKVQGFDDVVIFVHDVGQSLAKLDSVHQHLIKRIALQEYTQGETATMMGLSLRYVHQRYLEAIDRLTDIFLDRGLLEPLSACQEAEGRL